ncbi:MAG: type II toxin-antitoxin system HipA family toxin [Mariprofundaceae bacterium]|nr:type II toxin-antitoxin system HipA family toxin [Mariprofundaceae bacterium]
MSALNVFYHGDAAQPCLVGQLALYQRKIYFEYDGEFLNKRLQLSPFLLPNKLGVQTPAAGNPWKGLFGVFNDSLPDGWGMLLMNRHLQSLGVDPRQLTQLDRLAYIGSRGMGALSYQPSKAVAESGFVVDLSELAVSAEAIYTGRSSEYLAEMAQTGGSPGGARPKVLVHIKGDNMISGDGNVPDGYEPWIVKFHAGSEATETGRVEYAYSLMAKDAGIVMPETRLFEGEQGNAWFGIKRFDREQGKHIHMHTLAGLVDADFRLPSLDYIDVLKITQALTHHAGDVEQTFTLMVFNVLARNRDDHAKNFSFLMDDQGVWRLSPAYDLTFSDGINGEHTTAIAGEGKAPDQPHMRWVGEKVGLKQKQMSNIFERVDQSIAKWDKWCDRSGVNQKSHLPWKELC